MVKESKGMKSRTRRSLKKHKKEKKDSYKIFAGV